MKIFSIKIEKEYVLLIIMALLKLLIHFGTNAFAGYGIFRDEFYYLACSHNLDFGYVDQPPLSIYILGLNRFLFGDTLFALRLIPALAGALTVTITGLMVRKLGGGRFAIILASLSVIAAPIFLGTNSIYSMNCIDILFWSLGAYLIIRIIQEDNPKLWLKLGMVIGFGLLNKISMGFFGLGLLAAIILTSQRKNLLTRWPYLAGLLAGGIFLPYIIWNIGHNFAHLEFIRNATNYKYANLTPIDFISGQLLLLHPVNLPVWLSGLYFYFFNKKGKTYRLLGIIWLMVFLIFIINGHSKAEYMSPAYPLLFAAGAVQIEILSRRRFFKHVKYLLPAVIVSGGIITAPMAIPCLPVETYIRYSKALGITAESSEAKELTDLPQHYADMFGWENMARTVSEVYATIPPEEKLHTVVYANNYGEAGAIEYYSRKYDLPPVICPHNNYWIWGWRQRNKKYQTVIIIGGNILDHLSSLNRVEQAAMIQCLYCMPYENNLPVFIGRKLKRSLEEIWESNKNYN